MLMPGATHVHYHAHNVNRYVYPTRFDYSTGFIEGLSSGVIYVVEGQPVEATNASLSTAYKANITTAIVDLNVMVKYKAEVGQKYNNKLVYQPNTTGQLVLKQTQSNGAFKALIDNSKVWSLEVEGG